MGTNWRRLLPLAPLAGAFLIEIVAIIALYRRSTVLLAVLCLEAGAVLRVWHEPSNRTCFVITAVLGTLAELTFVSAGVWRYAHPSVAGVPLWFPVSFGLAGLLLRRLVQAVLDLED